MNCDYGRMILTLTITMATLCSPVSAMAGTTTASKSASTFTTAVDHYLIGEGFNGSVLVAKGSRILYSKGMGMANFASRIRNTPDTEFRIGSLTKQFTAMAILELQARHKLNVTDTVQKYLPTFPNGKRITIQELLDHESGIPEYLRSRYIAPKMLKRQYTPVQLINLVSHQPLDFIPGTNFEYSNSNYVLLGYIIEKVSGESYADFIEQNIIKPLGLQHTGYDSNMYNVHLHATGYGGTLQKPTSAQPLDMSIAFSAGGLYSSAHDLFLWNRALDTDRLLPKNIQQTMFTPHLSGYGDGWFIIGDIEYHGGDIPGYHSFEMRNSKTHTLIVLLTNSDSEPAILQGIADNLTELTAQIN